MSFKTKIIMSCTILGSLCSLSSDLLADESVKPIPYVQDFTAYTLNQHQVKIGLAFDYGLVDSVQIGTDMVAAIAGAPNLKLKILTWEGNGQRISLGAHGTYLDRKTALWGDISEVFSELDAKLVRPQISWSHKVSDRLTIHSHWSIGIGNVSAKLSEYGRRKLWKSKYPNGDYDTGTKDSEGNSDENLDANYEVSHRTLQVQALLGLSRDVFQVTGEFVRDQTKRILLTSRLDRTQLEDLYSQGLRVTAAQEWQVNSFHFRLGLGVLYQVLSGNDLDGDPVDNAGFTPIGDIDFYWLF